MRPADQNITQLIRSRQSQAKQRSDKSGRGADEERQNRQRQQAALFCGGGRGVASHYGCLSAGMVGGRIK